MIRIISGGQSGADRAALDFALAQGLEYGGWCPKGGWAEDFPHPPGVLAHYPRLRETPEDDPRTRTEWNVRDSDAALVIAPSGIVSPGTAFTIECAHKHAKPLLVVDPHSPRAIADISAWLKQHPDLRSLNIAGPRASEAPDIYAAVRALFDALFA
jgi:hypothetical protein